jgi:outer membrane protein OmpA-like peptidoglycan-associated protein
MLRSFVASLRPAAAVAALLLGTSPGIAAPSGDAAADSIVLYFDTGSASIRPQDEPLLDKAARTFREGKPIIMTVSGNSDAAGDPQSNLRLSQRRADNVFRGLVARGIPADRFQVIANGQTDPVVQAAAGTAEAKNRRAEITWR